MEIARLGDELRRTVITPESAYWPTYEHFLKRSEYLKGILQSQIETLLSEKDVSITGRTKSRDTLRAKLVNLQTMKLGSIDDIIGIRIVGDFNLDEQDEIAALLDNFFDPVHKKIDRRSKPTSGYRAVHRIVKIEEMHAEIQIRTLLQSQWADLFERTADTWGRQIRYGLPPDCKSDIEKIFKEKVINRMIELSVEYISIFEEHSRHINSKSEEADPDLFVKKLPSRRELIGSSRERIIDALKFKQSAYRSKLLTERWVESEKSYKESVMGLKRRIDSILEDLAGSLE